MPKVTNSPRSSPPSNSPSSSSTQQRYGTRARSGVLKANVLYDAKYHPTPAKVTHQLQMDDATRPSQAMKHWKRTGFTDDSTQKESSSDTQNVEEDWPRSSSTGEISDNDVISTPKERSYAGYSLRKPPAIAPIYKRTWHPQDKELGISHSSSNRCPSGKRVSLRPEVTTVEKRKTRTVSVDSTSGRPAKSKKVEVNLINDDQSSSINDLRSSSILESQSVAGLSAKLSTSVVDDSEEGDWETIEDDDLPLTPSDVEDKEESYEEFVSKVTVGELESESSEHETQDIQALLQPPKHRNRPHSEGSFMPSTPLSNSTDQPLTKKERKKPTKAADANDFRIWNDKDQDMANIINSASQDERFAGNWGQENDTELEPEDLAIGGMDGQEDDCVDRSSRALSPRLANAVVQVKMAMKAS
ncbi:MAG: hypothetical protein M1820_008200 [Bogoriella megaspora]|nr:MAG: hypothetical protein M1820_008200 [Bogoriella megaspora]